MEGKIMNNSQTIFTLFFALYFVIITTNTGKFHPFDTPSMFRGNGKAWMRGLCSLVILDILPILYFYLVFTGLENYLDSEFNIINLFFIFFLSLIGNGFYRLFYGLMLIRNRDGYIFYDPKIYNDSKGLPKDVKKDLKSRPKSHEEPYLHILPGSIWVVSSYLIALYLFCWEAKMYDYINSWVEIVYKIVLILGVLIGGIAFIWRVLKRKQQEKILTKIGKLRAEGVAIRNEGINPKKGDELTSWLKEAKKITCAINNAVKEFDPVIGEILEIVDTYKPKQLAGQAKEKDYCPDQLRHLCILTERLDRVKIIIDKYYAPKSYRPDRG